MRKRASKWWMLLLIPILLPVLFLLIERWRGQIGLARYKKALAAKGEKISPADFALTFNEADNGIPLLVREISKLTTGKVLPDEVPSQMRLLPSGHAVVGFREDEWFDAGGTNFWDELALDWETNVPVLSRISDALKMPVFNSRLDYSQGFNLLIPNLSSSKKLAFWFSGGSQLALRHGENHKALERLLSQILLPHICESDRLAISELVRDALASNAKNSTWEALQAVGWSDDDLQQIQIAWDSHDFISSAFKGLEGDFVYSDVSYDLLRNSNEEAFKIFFTWKYTFVTKEEPNAWKQFWEDIPFGDEIREFAQKQIFCPVWRFAWSYQAQLRSAKEMHDLLETMRSLKKTKSLASIRDDLDKIQKRRETKSFYDKARYPWPEMPYTLSQVVTKAARAQTDCSVAICAVALKRYDLRHRKLPASLELLVPEFLPSVPIDFMDGKPMKYFQNPDGSSTLYSVGEDGIDNHGDGSLPPSRTAVRSVWDRKDAVWPAVATPEEIAEFRKSGKK